MHEERAEGVILRAVPYQDCHHIITLFTSDRGLVSLFVRGTHRSRHFSHALVTPFTRAEFIYTVREGSHLHRFKDAAVLDQHLDLRQNYATLEAACAMAQGLLATQCEGKAAPDLYRLFVAYLDRAGRTPNNSGLLASFLLKILKHEGLSTLHTSCSFCNAPLDEIHMWGSEAFCEKHAPQGSIFFTSEERAALLNLSALRSFNEILTIEVSPPLRQRVEDLFTYLTT